MLAELRTKSQITLPKTIVSNLGLSEGDQLEVYEKNGTIYMTPVAVYPTSTISELQKEISKMKTDIKNGKQPVFDNLDSLFEALEK